MVARIISPKNANSIIGNPIPQNRILNFPPALRANVADAAGELKVPDWKQYVSKQVDLIHSYSAAFSSNPLVIWSDGATGYSPEKQASQYCGLLLSRLA